MDIDIRGEMEAAAAELAAEPDASPASDETTTGEPEAAPEPEAAAEDAAPATEEPAAEEPVAKSEPEPQPESDELPLGGSIPVPRVRKILENARAKARAEVEAQLQWAKEMDRAKVDQALAVYNFAESQPIEFYRAVTQRLLSDPQLAEQARAIMSPTAPQAQPEADPTEGKPQPDVLLEDGRLVYSAEQMNKLLEWQDERVEAKLASKVKPFEEREREHQRYQFIEQETQRVLKEVMTWPGMQDKENQKAVSEAMIANKLPIDAAYRAVVLPKLTDTASIEKRVREQVLAELKQKTRATTDNPARQVGVSESFKGKSVREILEATAAELGME